MAAVDGCSEDGDGYCGCCDGNNDPRVGAVLCDVEHNGGARYQWTFACYCLDIGSQWLVTNVFTICTRLVVSKADTYFHSEHNIYASTLDFGGFMNLLHHL